MDLNPFYDLHARLHAGAVAGAALASEDFRLSRALEALAPLESAAPVFRKLGQLTRNLLSPDCPDRAGALLDALSLADAIACTQGAVGVPGEITPLPLVSRGRAVTNAPYSVLSPLLEALTTSGGGKFSFVLDTHKERPELFQDYRVRETMVQALDASYAGLAQQVEEWLGEEDESILPLLQNDFEPKGNKEMVRRVHVIEKVAGAGANRFYLDQLPKSEKEVRAALIWALRLDRSNTELLITLCKTEKGKCKEAAHWALAGFEEPEALDYWTWFSSKKPGKAAEYMIGSTTEKSGELIARALDRWLAPYEKDAKTPLTWSGQEELQTLIYALPGKSNPDICRLYHRMAALETALDFQDVEGAPGTQKTAMRLHAENYRETFCFSELVPEILRVSLLFHPTPDLLALAGELERQWPGRFTAPALTAALLAGTAGDVWTLARPILEPSWNPLKQKEIKKARQALRTALGTVCWDEKEQRQALYNMYNIDRRPFANESLRVETIRQPLREPLDTRIYEALLDQMDQYDELVLSLIPTIQDPELQKKAGERLYERAVNWGKMKSMTSYLRGLQQCGWTKCEGLLEAYCKTRKVSTWDVLSFLDHMPGSIEDIAAEVQRVLTLAREGKIKTSTTWYPANIAQWIEKKGGTVKV